MGWDGAGACGKTIDLNPARHVEHELVDGVGAALGAAEGEVEAAHDGRSLCGVAGKDPGWTFTCEGWMCQHMYSLPTPTKRYVCMCEVISGPGSVTTRSRSGSSPASGRGGSWGG